MTIQRVPQVPFAQIANAALRDVRLSFKARGVLALVLSNVGEWEATAEWIERQSERDGRTAVQSALNELTEFGYRRVLHERGPNGHIRTVAEWSHEPVTRSAENPTSGDPDLRESGGCIEDHLLEHYLLEDHEELSPDPFDSFWEVYPRKAGKAQARKAFAKAIRRVPVDVIVAGAVAYRDDPNREDGFTAHAATWLNGERWEDDPLPVRSGGAAERNRRDLEGLMARAAERDARRAIGGSYGHGTIPAGEYTPQQIEAVRGVLGGAG